MIEKMKFLSITGPKTDIDRVVNTYLSKYEIHLENALSELTAVESLSPFMEINPYKEALSTANSFYDELADPEKISAKPMDTEQALNTIRRIQSDYQELSNKRADLESQLAALDESLRVIRPFRNINYNISSILKFQFIHFRFGRIEKEYYQKFEKYIYENLDTIFIKCDEDDQYVWGLYFVPEHEAQKVKAVYSSMHFERIYMPDTYEGTAKEAFEQLTETRNRAAADLASADQYHTGRHYQLCRCVLHNLRIYVRKYLRIRRCDTCPVASPDEQYDVSSVYRKAEYSIYCCHWFWYVPDPFMYGI